MSNKKLMLLPVILSAPLLLGAAGEKTTFNPDDLSGSHTIHVLNLEDYIYLDEEDNENDLIHQFERYANEKFGLDDVKVIYDTSDTNENEYNDLLTGRIQYDLVCTSDYMLQRFAREHLIERLSKDEIEYLDYYNTYASKAIKARLDEIPITVDGEEVKLQEYAVGYMWGTLGLLVNPTYSKNVNGFEKTISDSQSWDILWNSNYKNLASIKNSMRDTYAVALMHGYDKELETLKQDLWKKIVEGTVTEQDYENYNKELEIIFNKTDDATLNMVSNEFYTLKQNIFGLEVDSGKQDIVTGKIGINLAWSGDAVYSMDLAEEEVQPLELYYSIPENGSNIWFDGWAIPVNEKREAGTKLLALEFLNFISNPEIAALNMEYTGYTSFIGGDSILDLVRSWYDAREELIYYYAEEEGEEVEYELAYKALETGEDIFVSYNDIFDINNPNPDYDEVPLYYVVYLDEEDEEGNPLYELEPYLDEEGNPVYFNDQLGFEYDEYEEVDLSYFFNGSFTKYEDGVDSIFYSDCYLPFSEEGNISVGRQFFCQYPDEDTVNRCCVMKDYGDDNLKVVKLWEASKSEPLPVWAIVTFAVLVAAGIGIAGYIYLGKYVKKKLRIARQKEKQNIK